MMMIGNDGAFPLVVFFRISSSSERKGLASWGARSRHVREKPLYIIVAADGALFPPHGHVCATAGFARCKVYCFHGFGVSIRVVSYPTTGTTISATRQNLQRFYLRFFVTLVNPSSSTSGGVFCRGPRAKAGASSITTSAPCCESSSQSESPDSQSVSWSASSALLNR